MRTSYNVERALVWMSVALTALAFAWPATPAAAENVIDPGTNVSVAQPQGDASNSVEQQLKKLEAELAGMSPQSQQAERRLVARWRRWQMFRTRPTRRKCEHSCLH